MEVFNKPSFFNNHIGGKDKLTSEQTRNQIKILQLQKQSKSDKSTEQRNKLNLYDDVYKNGSGTELYENNIRRNDIERTSYDPLYDWNLTHGLLGKTNARYTTHFLGIDSSTRQIKPIINVSDFVTLDNNPISTTELSSRIKLIYPNHNFLTGDKIIIDGIAPIKTQLSVSQSNKPLEFIVGQTYMIINLVNGHGIPENQSSNPNISNLYISIDGFTNATSLYYGNIPLTYINKTHNFFLVDPTRSLSFNENKMYIELPYAYSETPGTPTILSSYVTISMYYVDGIPTNMINAKYPTDIYHSNNYQIVNQTDDTGFYINIRTNALSSGNVGGGNVQIAKVTDFSGGYTEPNSYTINLENIYKNVVSVRMISSEFPNSEYVIKNYPTENQNNKIYWQNYEDGSHTYSVEITPGKYNPNTLVTAIQESSYDVTRYLYPSVTQNYTNHNYIRVNIDTDTDTTTFSSYKEILMTRPFVNLYYIRTDSTNDHVFTQIGSSTANDPKDPSQLYPLFILIYFPDHGLEMNTSYKTHIVGSTYVPDGSVGDEIILSGVNTYKGIPGTTIDGTYEAYYPNSGLERNPKDYFMIKLIPFDIGQYTKRDDAQYGGIFYVYIPNIFRLLFDKSDTMGTLLGFPNVGETFAITKFGKSITNKDAYQPDISQQLAVDTTTPGNSIMLSGYNYILMVCDELKVLDTSGTIKNALAKILLVGIPGKVCFNTFVCTPKIFYNPIPELSSLTMSFYTPNGKLFDFNGLDHSFTLEITTLDDLPNNTNINTHTGNRL